MTKYPELDSYRTLEIPLRVIYFDRSFNCRGEFAPISCFELADSMKAKGLKIPIIVQPITDVPGPVDDEYEYRVVAGHRRWSAARYILRWKTIPATVITGLSDEDARVLNLVENLERKNLTFYQEAVALRHNYSEGTSYAKMARDLNKSSAWCRYRWKLFELPEKVVKLVKKGILRPSDLRTMLYKTKEQQLAMAMELEAAKLYGSRPSGHRTCLIRSRSRSRKEIDEMLTELMLSGQMPDFQRSLMWAAGRLTTDEFLNPQAGDGGENDEGNEEEDSEEAD